MTAKALLHGVSYPVSDSAIQTSTKQFEYFCLDLLGMVVIAA